MSHESTTNHEQRWHDLALALPWFTPWHTILVSQKPVHHWFVGGTINASYACVDIHQSSSTKNKIALHWEGETGQSISWSYEKLFREVNRFAYVLAQLGVKQNDIVILYLPMIPEAIAAMLAVSRLGAIHSAVFSGFSGDALKGRINDSQATFIITSDASYRRGKVLNPLALVTQIIDQCPSIKQILVIPRVPESSRLQHEKIRFVDAIITQNEQPFVPAVPRSSQDPLFILYTSGTTGNPKGIIHATGGYLTYVYSTFKWAFAPTSDTVYWCTADIGWITGHSYVTYAPLMHGVTMVIQEGTLDFPDAGRWWQLIERYKVSTFYTSPTALRMCIKYGNEFPEKYDLSSLKLLGSVGEPINPEVWQWYHSVIGHNRCPIVDTWWQTETGGFIIAPTPGLSLVPLKPGSATKALPGIDVAVVNEQGAPVTTGSKGYLVIRNPWPGMAVGILNDHERFKEVYWTKFPGMYYPGDYATQDSDGYFWLLGRADEVVNISGHRIGTVEVESAVIELDEIVEAAAIGINDELRGEAIVIFAIVNTGITTNDHLKELMKAKVHANIGKFITPKEIYFVSKLPKTRSGKIMRRLLKAVLEGSLTGDISTLEDETSMHEIQETYRQMKNCVATNSLETQPL